jgi:RHS repeat-associated protein
MKLQRCQTENDSSVKDFPQSIGATNVTANTSNAVIYADVAFASTNQPWVGGDNTYTAIARDAYGRRDTNSVTVNLQPTNSYTYDLNGNLLSDGRRGFAYDDENQLIRVTVTNAWKSEFSYDGKLRRRMVKEFTWNGSWVQTNEVHYVYDGNLVVQERSADNLPQVSYTRGTDLSGSMQGAGGIGGLLARTDNSKLLVGDTFASALYHADGNGNVTCLIYPNQTIAAKYLYDPYGNMLSMYGSLADANSYRFSSKEWNANSGLYYYLYRLYDPTLQRWLNRDPIGEAGFRILQYQNNRFLQFISLIDQIGGFNLYGFVKNQPTDYRDYLGLMSQECMDAIAILQVADLLYSMNPSPENAQAVRNALNKAKQACGPPPPIPPIPTPCPIFPSPIIPPPEVKKECGWALVGGALLWICRAIIIAIPVGA